MKNLNIPVGISDFERIRELNYYYVDKTGLIKTLLQGEMDQVTLITRPRRFGKRYFHICDICQQWLSAAARPFQIEFGGRNPL